MWVLTGSMRGVPSFKSEEEKRFLVKSEKKVNRFEPCYATSNKARILRILKIFKKTSWGLAKPSSVSSLVRTRLRFTASSKMDFTFPHGPRKIEIYEN